MITIDGYDDIVRIGRGGLGDVYRATRVSTGGVVAIKVLRDISDESVAWHRTRRELTALVSLAGHANVIQLIELLELDQGPALVMEYAPGGSVADLMRRRDSTLTVGEAVLVGRHTAAALVAAHAQGIVHRDVKPQNLLNDAYGQVKLCDFGVAALMRTDDFRARTSALSLRYASPEDLDDDVDVGPASDVYSLGATLLHLARGAPPTLKERLAPWSPPASADAEAAALDAVVAACLHPDPSRRPTAGAVLDDLERLGWVVDERQRALVFDLPDDGVGAVDDVPTDRQGASGDARDDPTVRRSPTEHADDTVSAVSPPPVPPPRPPAHRPSWQPWLLGGVLAVLIAVPAFVLWAARDDPTGDSIAGDSAPPGSARTPQPTPPPSTGTTTETAPPPEVDVELVARPTGIGEPTDEGVVWPFGAIGECLVRVEDQLELRPVPCDEPHDMQRLLVAELDADRFPVDAPFAEAESRAIIGDACERAFADFTGVPYARSRLEAPFTAPSEASWVEGDRRYQCLLFAPGFRIVGDASDG